MEQDKTDKKMKQMKNQERESTAIQKLFKTHNRKIGQVKQGINDFGVKLAIKGVVSDFKQMEQTVRMWEQKQQMILVKQIIQKKEKEQYCETGMKEKEHE